MAPIPTCSCHENTKYTFIRLTVPCSVWGFYHQSRLPLDIITRQSQYWRQPSWPQERGQSYHPGVPAWSDRAEVQYCKLFGGTSLSTKDPKMPCTGRYRWAHEDGAVWLGEQFCSPHIHETAHLLLSLGAIPQKWEIPCHGVLPEAVRASLYSKQNTNLRFRRLIQKKGSHSPREEVHLAWRSLTATNSEPLQLLITVFIKQMLP